MSQYPNPPDPSQYPYQQPPYLNYPSPPDNAEKLVRLALTFNRISAILDALTCVALVLGTAVIYSVMKSQPVHPGDPPPEFIFAYDGLVPFDLAYLIVKLVAISKIKNRAPNARGWGLAAGIIGCCQIICGSCCWLQVAAGVYTLVVMCFENVRVYLMQPSMPSEMPQQPGNPFP